MGEDLDPREALAMVNTWADSWFAEEGTRMFYVVPREITDQVLPLTIIPAPDKTVRVLVGRVEVMTPTIERQLLELVQLQAKHRAVLIKRQLDDNKNDPIILPIPTRLAKSGRLAEPALVRIRELARDETVSHEASILLNECRAALDKQGTLEASISENPD